MEVIILFSQERMRDRVLGGIGIVDGLRVSVIDGQSRILVCGNEEIFRGQIEDRDGVKDKVLFKKRV